MTESSYTPGTILDAAMRAGQPRHLKDTSRLWFPISEFKDHGLAQMQMIASPKLINAVTNPEGIGLGYYDVSEVMGPCFTVAVLIDDLEEVSDAMVIALEDVTHFIPAKGPY